MVKKVLPSKGSRLAWLTEEEVGLLRRRDASLGSPEHKETPDGIPVLDRQADEEQAAQQKLYNKRKAAGWKMVSDPEGGGSSLQPPPAPKITPKAATNYVTQNAGLAAAWAGIQNPKTAQDRKNKEYWEKRGAKDIASFGTAHADETNALIAGTYKGATKVKAGTKTDFAKNAIPQLTKAKVVSTAVTRKIEEESPTTYAQSSSSTSVAASVPSVPDSTNKKDKKVKVTVNTGGEDGTHNYTQDEINRIISNSPNTNKYTAKSGYDYSRYVDDHGDLAQAWKEIQANPNGVQARYWIARMGGVVTKEAFGIAHAGESNALLDEKYKGATKCVKGTACYDNLKRTVAKQCGAGKEWDFGKEKCVAKTGGGCKANEEKVNGQCVPKCGSNQDRIGGDCVDKCTSGQVRCGGNCVNKCPSGQTMQSDCSCKADESQKSCINDGGAKKCGTWPNCRVCCSSGQTWDGTKCKDKENPDDPDDKPEPSDSVYGDEYDPWSEEGTVKVGEDSVDLATTEYEGGPTLDTVKKKSGLTDSEIVEKRMANLLTGDLAEKVKYEAKTALAARGLFNTAIAEAAGLSAVMEHAFQVASLDATHFYGAELEDVRATNDFAKTKYTTEATTYNAALNRAHEARQQGFVRAWNARENKTNRKWQSYEAALTRSFTTRMKKLDYDIAAVQLKSVCSQNAMTNFASQEQELFIAYGKEEMSQEIYEAAVGKLEEQMDALLLSCKAYNDPVKKTKFVA